MQGLARCRTGAARSDQRNRDDAGFLVDAAQHYVAAIGLQRRPDDFKDFFDELEQRDLFGNVVGFGSAERLCQPNT